VTETRSAASNEAAFAGFVQAIVRQYLARFPKERDRLRELEVFLPSGGDLRSRENMAGHVTASALLVDLETDRLLLVQHRVLDLWIPPGGHLESGETMLQAARREAAEEVGAYRWEQVCAGDPDVPIDIDSHLIPAMSARGEREHVHHDFRYLFAVRGGHWVREDSSEVGGHRWIRLHATRAADNRSLEVEAERELANTLDAGRPLELGEEQTRVNTPDADPSRKKDPVQLAPGVPLLIRKIPPILTAWRSDHARRSPFADAP
jgi:8-oxo-dGTP pyrophosphatase MutT (NUDIX family)